MSNNIPKVVGEGTYGCVHKPALKCKDKEDKNNEKSSGEDEQEDKDMKELIEQVKLLNKVMEYCAKNPKECE